MIIRIKRNISALAIGFLFLISADRAFALLIDFESLSEGTSVTNQFPGLQFTNATVLTAGSSLNELEFPPHSGSNVVIDDGGAIMVTFALPFSDAAGFFTYNEPITLSAFAPGGALLGSVNSLFPSNFVSSGNPPNEFLRIAGLGPIGSITISGNPGGGSFVLDDFQGSPVPEPASLLLLGSGLGGLWLRKHRKARKRLHRLVPASPR